jgi:hypothetical protein
MKSKFILTVAAGLLAGTTLAAAQPSGAPAGEKDRTGQPADSSTTSADRDQQIDSVGQGRGAPSSGAVVPPRSGPPATEPLPGEPKRGAAPRQGEGSGDDAIPRRK